MNAAPVDNGMRIGSPLLKHRVEDFDSLLLQGFFCLFGQFAARRGIDHSGGIWNFDASSEAETESDGLYRGSEKQRIERSMYVV